MSMAERTAVDWALGTGLVEKAVGAAMRRPILERAAAALFTLTVVVIAAFTWLRPDYNWDMVAYIASALEDRYQDPAALHAETWREIGADAPADKLYHIQYGNPYSAHQFETPADFQSQLSMYRVKLGYIEAMRFLEPMMGLVNASLMLNILPLLGIGALSLHWLGRENAMQGAFILAPFLIIAELTHMSTAVTPDILVSFVSLLAVYFLARGRDVGAGILLFLSVFVRPDNIVLIFALLITAFAFGWRKLPLLATFAASFLGCVAISKLGHHPGWWTHFYFSCVQMQNSMTGFHPDFSVAALLHGYVRGAMVALLDNDWPALLALMLAGWALLARAGRMRDRRANALMFALAIGALGKFAAFPLPDDRFYFISTAGMALILIARWRPRFDLMAARAAPALPQGA